MDKRVEALLREAGRRYERTRTAFTEGKAAAASRGITSVPTDNHGRARLVCRRHAVQRSVTLDENGRPACFDADHTDCRGCVEDIDAGRIETW